MLSFFDMSAALSGLLRSDEVVSSRGDALLIQEKN
jgi:hypothetical protein